TSRRHVGTRRRTSTPTACSPWSGRSCDEASPAARRTDALRAAALAEPRAQVRRPARALRPARARDVGGRTRARGRHGSPRGPAAAPRGAPLLRAAAAPRPEDRARAPAGGDRDAESVRGGVRLARTYPRAHRRRAARRLAHRDAPLRVAAPARALAARGRRRRVRATARDGGADDLVVHERARPRARDRARGGVPGVHG